MKNRIVDYILLVVGLVPFALPVLTGLYRMNMESWTFGDWFVLYTAVYWPTYIIGIAFLVIAFWRFLHR